MANDVTYEVLTNREKYPDDTVITFADGSTTTVKQWRDAALPKADFTRASEGWARERGTLTKERDDLRQSIDGLQGQLTRAVEERQKLEAGQAGNARTADDGQITQAQLEADPVVGPIFARLKAFEERAQAVEKTLTEHANTYLRDRYTEQLGSIRRRHADRFTEKDGFKPFDPKAFLDFAVERRLDDLDMAYRLYSHDDELRLREQAAEARGVEKGRTAAKVPAIPIGGRRPVARPEALKGITTLEQAEEAAASDPEILETFQSGAG